MDGGGVNTPTRTLKERKWDAGRTQMLGDKFHQAFLVTESIEGWGISEESLPHNVPSIIVHAGTGIPAALQHSNFHCSVLITIILRRKTDLNCGIDMYRRMHHYFTLE